MTRSIIRTIVHSSSSPLLDGKSSSSYLHTPNNSYTSSPSSRASGRYGSRRREVIKGRRMIKTVRDDPRRDTLPAGCCAQKTRPLRKRSRHAARRRRLSVRCSEGNFKGRCCRARARSLLPLRVRAHHEGGQRVEERKRKSSRVHRESEREIYPRVAWATR